MRPESPFVRGVQVFFLGCSLWFSPPGAETAHAEETSLAREIAERTYSAEAMLAFSIASMEELRLKTREALSEMVDMSSVSDRDLEVFLRVQTEINAKGMAEGLRKALTSRLEELPEKDLDIWLSCINGLSCEREKISPQTKSFIGQLSAFGKTKGEEIGQSVGEATTAKVLDKLLNMDESEFDDRDALIRAMSL